MFQWMLCALGQILWSLDLWQMTKIIGKGLLSAAKTLGYVDTFTLSFTSYLLPLSFKKCTHVKIQRVYSKSFLVVM